MMWNTALAGPGSRAVLLRVLIGWGAGVAVVSQAAAQPTVLAVRQDGAGGAYTTVTAAIEAIPGTLPNAYVVEIQDSETYKENVEIAKNTGAEETLTIRAQAGQAPTVRSDKKNRAAIEVASHYVILEDLILQGGSKRVGAHISWANHNTVRGCTVHGSKDKSTPGIFVQGGAHNNLVDNTLYDNDVGIRIYDPAADHNVVRNNLIRDNRERGIWIYRGARNNQVLNNTLYHNDLEIHLGKSGGKNDDPGSANIIRNNVIQAEAGGTCVAVDRRNDPGGLPDGTLSDYNILDASASGADVGRIDNTVYGDLASWQAATGQDAHSLALDPLFVDAPDDFHLQSTSGSYHGGAWTADPEHSPGIDAGDPADDYGDEPAPNGSRVNLGAYGNTPQASKAGSEEPQGAFNAVVQKSDGSGAVDVSIEVSHPGARDTRARLEWSNAESGTYADATLQGPATADHPDNGGPPDVNNGNSYQVGAGASTRIVTSEGSNTVTFDWAGATDLPNGDGTFWLRLTANDDLMDQGAPDKVGVTIDNVAPVGLDDLSASGSSNSAITWGWTPVSTESNFDGYAIWYGADQDDVLGRTGTALTWDSEDDGALGTMPTISTTITGLQQSTLYYAGIWALDDYGNEASAAVASYATAGLDTITHYVAKTGSDPGVANDPGSPWRTIQRAVDDMPADLTAAQTYYVVQIQDSGTYGEGVAIDKTAEEAYSVTLRSAPGQMPTIDPPNDEDGILVETPYVTIEGVAVDASDEYGVNVSEEDHVTIRGCWLYGGTSSNGGGIRLYRADHSRLVDNRIHGNRIGVLLAEGADHNSLRRNLILDDSSRDYGVYVDEDADSDSLINNVIVGYDTGLYFRGGGSAAGDDHVVRNNLFHDLDYCIYLDRSLGDTFDQCDYNDLHPADGERVGRIDGTRYETLVEWRAATGLDGHSLSLDPQFVDTSADPKDMDLHLTSQAGRWDGSGWVADATTSLCIDAGNPQDSYDLEPPPHGNRINMGAYGNTVEASKSGPLTVYKPDIPYDEYVMLGVPLVPEHASPDSVLVDDFGGFEGGNPWGYWWRLVRWNVEEGGYSFYKESWEVAGDPPDFHPGRGFWLIQWWSLWHPDGSTEGDTVSVTGVPVPLDTDFAIALEYPSSGRGVNQLANPFLFPIDWADARVRNNGSGQVRTMADAAQQGWVDGHAYRWDWDRGNYRPISASDGGTIDPWMGFWVEQLDAGLDLSVLVPPVDAGGHAGKPLAVARPSPEDWHVQFSVSCVLQVTTEKGLEDVRYGDDFNRIGVKPDASRRYDAHDAVDLPVPSEPYVYVFFPHGDADDTRAYWPARPGRYTYDIRDPEWVDQVWTFVVETDLTDQEMTWAWTNPEALPGGYQIALEDADADTVVIPDIRATQSLEFSSEAEGERRFRLRAEYEDVSGDVSGDRIVDADDAAEILRHVVGLEPLAEFALDVTNVSGDSGEDVLATVSPYDAALILQYEEGLIDVFPVDTGEEPQPTEADRFAYLSSTGAAGDGQRAVSLVVDELDGVFSGLVRLSYDPAVLAIEDATVGEGIPAYLSAYAVTEGQAILAFAGARPGSGTGVLGQILVRPKASGPQALQGLRLEAVQFNEGQIRAGFVPTAVALAQTLPEAHFLYPNYPNPFNPTTVIRYDLPTPGLVDLAIYNAVGQHVRTLVRQDQQAGTHGIVWDGRDQQGRAAASGLYLCRMRAGEFRLVRKLVLMR